MIEVKHFTPPNPLREKLRTGPGITVPDALERAAVLVGEISASLLASVDAEIDRALGCAAHAGPGNRGDLYDCADHISAIGAACGLPALSAAALALCEVLDWMDSEHRWDVDVVAAHVVALVVLRATASTSAGLDLLQALASMRARLAPAMVDAAEAVTRPG